MWQFWLEQSASVRTATSASCSRPTKKSGAAPTIFDLNQSRSRDYGYTLDGSAAGEIAFENFNAGVRHPPFSRQIGPPRQRQAARWSTPFAWLSNSTVSFRCFDRPEHTEGYEGFNHIHSH
ncbi:MAG: hypothetical protein MZU97_16675 [Bacillus subtilis]|nr:hypothetical protein [Bacillus subtilis]